MSKRNGFWLRFSLVSWWAHLLVRGSIFLICLVLALPLPVWSGALEDSEPDWPELTDYLNEIDAGLNMIDLPLSEIENNLTEREQNLSEREAASLQKERELNETELRLQEREQGLNAREQDLQGRESLYNGMQVDLDAATIALGKAKTRGLVIAILLGIAAGAAGYGIGRLAD